MPALIIEWNTDAVVKFLEPIGYELKLLPGANNYLFFRK
jgi:hypothetical protein